MRILLSFLLTLLCSSIWASSNLDTLLHTIRNEQTPEKLYQLSRIFLAKPYLGNALGEGEKGHFDRAPLMRFDAFDCQTYMSTLLALLHAQDEKEALTNIAHIRYRNGNISYVNRLHFASLDWNQENTRTKRLRNITPFFHDAFDQPLAQHSHARIDVPTWLQRRPQNSIRIPVLNTVGQKARLDELHRLAESHKAQISKVDYLPLTQIVDLHGNLMPSFQRALKSGTLMEVVRPKWDLRQKIGSYLQISHMGLILHHHHQWWFHHASSQQGQIVDELLGLYLKKQMTSPTIKGIHLMQIH